MWDVPDHRIKAYLQSLKRPKQSRSPSRFKAKFHVRKVNAELRELEMTEAQDLTIPARALLNDFGPTSIKLFTQTKLRPGHELALTLEAPRRFYVQARVVSCQEIPHAARILSDRPAHYRVELEFLFESQEEAEAVSTYSDRIQTELKAS